MTSFETEWARCSPWIEAALACAPFYELDDVRQEIMAGEAQFWPGEHSALVTQIWTFPRTRALNLWLAAGDLAELVEKMRPQVEAWAQDTGCRHVLIAGRSGWARALRGEGYQPYWTCLGKEMS